MRASTCSGKQKSHTKGDRADISRQPRLTCERLFDDFNSIAMPAANAARIQQKPRRLGDAVPIWSLLQADAPERHDATNLIRSLL